MFLTSKFFVTYLNPEHDASLDFKPALVILLTTLTIENTYNFIIRLKYSSNNFLLT